MQELVIGGIYRHYKNQDYRVLSLGRHSETLEEMVIYECLYPCELGQIWTRPKALFLSDIEINGVLQPRFRLKSQK
jgi:hypothetical protein